MAKKAEEKIKPEDLGVHVNLMTDIGFNKIFDNKEVMFSFLNKILEKEGGVTDFQYGNPERPKYMIEGVVGIYELFCINGKGERIIVEIQVIPQVYFRNRITLYTKELFQERIIMGKYRKYPLYSINILDFCISENKEKQKYISHSQLVDSANKNKACGNMLLIYIELPHFQKELHELNDLLEQWIFVFKNLHKLDSLPEELRNEVFEALFEDAKIEKLSSDELTKYKNNLLAIEVVDN